MSVYCSQQGQGENLVLLHGWGMNSAVWKGLLPYLQENYCVYSIDLPGHGSSEIVHEVCDDEILDAWLDALQVELPEYFYVCGWSLGGMLALALRQRWPEQVLGVVLLASSPRFMRDDVWPGVALNDLLLFAQHLEDNVKTALREFIKLQFLNVKNSRAAMHAVMQDIQQQGEVSREGMQQGLFLLQEMDFRMDFSQQTCAVLLGEQDRLVSSALGPAMQTLNANCHIELWPNSGHAPHLIQPELVAQFIHYHLAGEVEI